MNITYISMTFFTLALIMVLFFIFLLCKNLPKNELMKVLIPVAIGIGIGFFFILIGLRSPTCEFGRFM